MSLTDLTLVEARRLMATGELRAVDYAWALDEAGASWGRKLAGFQDRCLKQRLPDLRRMPG